MSSFSTPYECLNCSYMGDCKETSEEKAREKYSCDKWSPAQDAVVAARNQILQDYGVQGLQSILTTKTRET